MKYFFLLFLLLCGSLFSGSANAICFDYSIGEAEIMLGTCGTGIDTIKVTVAFAIWVLLLVTYGQTLLLPRVHLFIKYTLFLLTFPLSLIVLLQTFGAKGVVSYFMERKKTSNHDSRWRETNDSQSEDALKASSESVSKDPQPALSIGEFTFDYHQKSLNNAQQNIPLEPKCMEVLSYLIEQQPRIVSLEELHTNVWPNQIVTDTAVRRVISKLRTAFSDTDTKNPKYIKSVMKRGYQLIAPVSLDNNG